MEVHALNEIVLKWMIYALRQGFGRENKRRLYELINLSEVLSGNNGPGKEVRAYNFLISLKQTEEVIAMIKEIE